MLRFAVLFSSVSGVIPALGVGQSDYAMGNAFLDHLAQAYAGELPVTSIQWPSWQESGFGEVRNQAYTDTGLLSITDAEGTMFLDEILAAPRGPVVMPVRVDADRFEPGALLGVRRRPVASPVPSGPVPSGPSPVGASARDTSLRERLVAFLGRTFETELGLTSGQLDEHTAYADYGADSILLTQVLQRIRQRLHVELDPATLLEHPTVSELAARLLSAHRTALAEAFGDEADASPAGRTRAEESVARQPVAGVAPVGTPLTPTVERQERATPGAGVPGGRDTAVAVIGMAARLPGAPDLDAYWQLLSEGRRAIRAVPDSRWGRASGARAGVVDDVHGFDAGYFMLHPEDVRAMDPQALVLLEESLKAIHHAGYRREDLDGARAGVYVGARGRGRVDDSRVDAARNPIMTVGQNYLAANVSQFFNWSGPALVVDTACSSALVAMRAAADALATGLADLALVAGVSLLEDDSSHELFRRRGLLREDGEFHIFDRRAGGVVLGEGAGVVVLKPLDRAERDGDTVYAVIEGIALNNDGRTAGPATPNPAAQKEVMAEALRRAGLRPDRIGHLDVNGSGSELTDLLELKAIDAVYGEGRSTPLRLGSMKPNIGHPLCAEGIAAFIKVALMLHHQRTVPFLSGEEPMEYHPIDPDRLDLPRHSAPVDLAHAALSSFADGGTNGHVILGRGGPGRRGPLPPPDLDRRDVRTGGRVGAAARTPVWTRRLDARDAVLAGHRVHGRLLLPGLAWIDLLHGCFAELTPEAPPAEMVVEGLTIYRPLSVDDGGAVEIRIEARAEGPDGWRITVTDAAPRAVTAVPYVTAELRRAGRSAGFDEQVPAGVLAVLGAADGRTHDLEEVYRAFRAAELVHSGPMKAVGAAYVTREDVWVRVALDEHAAGDEPDRLFHPALIDASAVAASASVLREGDDRRLFLPLHHGAFRADAALGRSCYTRVRRDSVRFGAELLTFTMEFFDARGARSAS